MSRKVHYPFFALETKELKKEVEKFKFYFLKELRKQ